tara:strand:- start:768 stop:1040 length:273 start_codon:yes stop_codon:yes gene_type:complete
MEINVSRVVVRPLYKVELEMTQDEINFLRCVVGSVSGNTDGPRGTTEKIYRALGEAGAKSTVLSHGSLSVPNTWEAFHAKMQDAINEDFN